MIARIIGSQLNKDKSEILKISTIRIIAEYQQYTRGQVKICAIVFVKEDLRKCQKVGIILITRDQLYSHTLEE